MKEIGLEVQIYCFFPFWGEGGRQFITFGKDLLMLMLVDLLKDFPFSTCMGGGGGGGGSRLFI